MCTFTSPVLIRSSYVNVIEETSEATVTPDRTISGSNDWLRLAKVRPIGNFCYDLIISSSGRIPRPISKRGRAITNDWRISMAGAIAGHRATSGSDQRPMYDQS